VTQVEEFVHTVSSVRANEESFLSSDTLPNELYESSLGKFDLMMLDDSDVSGIDVSGALISATDGFTNPGASLIGLGISWGEALGERRRDRQEILSATLRVQLGASRSGVSWDDSNLWFLASFELATMARL
jgi:hypothetical protein